MSYGNRIVIVELLYYFLQSVETQDKMELRNTHLMKYPGCCPRNLIKELVGGVFKYCKWIANSVLAQNKTGTETGNNVPEIRFAERENRYDSKTNKYGTITELEETHSNQHMGSLLKALPSSDVQNFHNFLENRLSFINRKIKTLFPVII